jgi:3-oxoacyl-[acyl-carrier-protein] synthase-1
MGRGTAATLDALLSRRSGLRPCDFEDVDLPVHIGRVEGVEDAAMPAGLERFDCRNNRLACMALATDGFAEAARDAARRHGPERVAVVLGTSTSGVHACEGAYRRRDPESGALPADFDYRHTHDLFSLAKLVREALACAARRSSPRPPARRGQDLRRGRRPDRLRPVRRRRGRRGRLLCGMTLHGFRALDLLAPGPCRPCAADRDGISIAEAAAFALLERPDDAPSARTFLLGHGASGDAHHMSSPHPRASAPPSPCARRSARPGSPADIDYVNFHGTGTRANDAAEDAAVHEVSAAARPAAPPRAGPATRWRLGCPGGRHRRLVRRARPGAGLPERRRGRPRLPHRHRRREPGAPGPRVVSNSFGFGGSNCSLVLGEPLA